MKIWVLNPPFLAKFSRPQRSPAVTKSGTLYFPIWLAFATGVLEQAGHEVVLTDAPARGLTNTDILEMGKNMGPGLIVMDTSTPSINNDIRVAGALKAILPKTVIVFVGTHVSALPEETLAMAPAVDAVARKEYEYTLRELASILEKNSDRSSGVFSGIEGLSFWKESQIIHNPDRPFISNLDELPWVSRVYAKHLNISDYFNPNALFPMVTLITSRGCPFLCRFCVYPQTMTGRKFRLRSIEDVVEEIRFVQTAFPNVKSIFLEDDTLTVNKNRLVAFSEALIKSDVRIPFVANSRIDLDLETMKIMKAAGCQQLCVGFESGNQEILNEMRKGTKIERMDVFMENARKSGILIHGCFMVGFPGETKETAEQTIDLALRLNPDTVQFYPVMVYPGTEAYQDYLEKGWLAAPDFRAWLTPAGLHNCVIRNDVFSPADLVKWCDDARRRFYLRPAYIAYKLRQIILRPSLAVRTAKAALTFFRYLIFGSRA
jgi:anaerobic magnesium-protoporphyrin IX monomethyl ester cyclase